MPRSPCGSCRGRLVPPERLPRPSSTLYRPRILARSPPVRLLLRSPTPPWPRPCGMKKAFITYSHADTVFVDRLVSDLESIQGLSVAFDKRVLKPGDSLLKLFEEIGESGFLIPVLSPSSVASNWVKKELSVAIVREIEEPNTFKVIPAIHPDAKWNEIRGTLPAH